MLARLALFDLWTLLQANGRPVTTKGRGKTWPLRAFTASCQAVSLSLLDREHRQRFLQFRDPRVRYFGLFE